MENYKSAINHSLNCCPELRQYLDKFVIPAPGDWPTWFYEKKLIAQGMNESSPLLSFIPEQGPFHVFLNLQEDVLKIYHFILERIYMETFGSNLPKKPKPFRISLVITAVFLAWTKLHHRVLQKFQLCKDIEYSCLLFLLDEVIPLSFFHYPVTFRSGNLDDYMTTMLKLSILFIIWQRRHYDRSTLPMLSDFCFHKQHFPQYHELKKKWLVLITEKKVEIWHSVLRSIIQVYDKAAEIRAKATSFAASKSEQRFHTNFTKPYSRGFSNNDLSIIAGKGAEVLLSTIKKVGQNLGKSKQVDTINNILN